MSIPLALLLILYILVVGVFLLFVFFHFYHLIRFAFWNTTGYVVSALYLLVSLAVLLISARYLSTIDWTVNIEFLNFISEGPLL